MKTLTEQLANYALYHRDRRNIRTHFIGIPLIVFAVMVLLSRAHFYLAGLDITPALLVASATVVYYLMLSLSLGLIMAFLFALLLVPAALLGQMDTAMWLGYGIGLFVVGWVFQFIGHYYEGKKPAFVDDLIGLAIGPLFVVAEVLFMLGLYKKLEQAICNIAGPTR